MIVLWCTWLLRTGIIEGWLWSHLTVFKDPWGNKKCQRHKNDNRRLDQYLREFRKLTSRGKFVWGRYLALTVAGSSDSGPWADWIMFYMSYFKGQSWLVCFNLNENVAVALNIENISFSHNNDYEKMYHNHRNRSRHLLESRLVLFYRHGHCYISTERCIV